MKLRRIAGVLTAALLLLTCLPVSAVTVTETETPAASEQERDLPYLTLDFTEGFPSGETEMRLYLAGNTGLGALGVWMRLPEQLVPVTDADGAPVFNATDAPAGDVQTLYDAESRRLALVFIAEQDAAPEEYLGAFRLHIQKDAEVGKNYPVMCIGDSISMNGATEFTCRLTNPFSPKEPPLRTLSETKLTMTEQNGTHRLTLSPEPPAGACEWKSSAPEVCAVGKDGTLTALSNGTAQITAECETRSYTCAVTVEIARVLAEPRISVDTLGGKVQLSMMPEPLHPAVWSSENEKILLVSESGEASVQACGTTYVTALCEETLYRFEVTAEIRRTLNVTEHTFTAPDETLKLFLTPSSYQKTVFLSADPDIAKVNSAGTVTPVGNGRTVITADCEGCSFQCDVTVALPVALNEEHFAGMPGESFRLVLLHVPEDAEHSMESSNPAAASVDENGLVTLHSAGSAEITVTWEGQTFVCKVTVQDYLRGDADGDGDVDAVDSMQALVAYATVYLAHEPCPLEPLRKRAADVDGDGDVTLKDAMAILRYYGAGVAKDVQDWDYAINPAKRG